LVSESRALIFFLSLSPCPSQSRSQSKGFEGQESGAERHPQSQKKEDPHVTYIPTTQDTASAEAAQISSKERPQEKQVSTVLSHEKMLGNLEIYQTYSMISQIHVGT